MKKNTWPVFLITLLIGCATVVPRTMNVDIAKFQIKAADALERIRYYEQDRCSPQGTCILLPSVTDPQGIRPKISATYGYAGILILAGFATDTDVANYYQLRGLPQPAVDAESVKHYLTYILKVQTAKDTYYYDYLYLCPPPDPCIRRIPGE
ncbi:MAG: hypothetical protein JWQ27_587 [Ferruginibacter sp.]|nr:hypothetical protein [Ferruginibacter sp.]